MTSSVEVNEHGVADAAPASEAAGAAAGKGLFYVPYPAAGSDLGSEKPRSGTFSPGFATPEWVSLAAAVVDCPDPVADPSPYGVHRRYRLVVGPGKLRVASTVTGDERDREASPRGEVTHWSAKSRTRMVETVCSLDWRPVVASDRPGFRPVMITLTLPGDWLAVAPTGRAFKRAFDRFRKRWARKWGEVAWLWKLEFQRRGAPHLHIYCAFPVGQEALDWLSRAWYEAVGSGDERHLRAGTGVDWGEGVRASDPKRLGIYFLKRATGHNLGSDKEYQHFVPEEWSEPGTGPGRFWGYYGLERCDVEVELDALHFVQLRRLMRRWSRANGRPLPWLGSSRMAGGMILANDGPGWLSQAARWLNTLEVPPDEARTHAQPRPSPVPAPPDDVGVGW